MEYFKKIYIKTEDNLPKEGICYVHQRLYEDKILMLFDFATHHRGLWTKSIDWYFQPVTEEEVQNELCIYPRIKK